MLAIFIYLCYNYVHYGITTTDSCNHRQDQRGQELAF